MVDDSKTFYKHGRKGFDTMTFVSILGICIGILVAFLFYPPLSSLTLLLAAVTGHAFKALKVLLSL